MRQAMQSPYMEWAKTRAQAKFNLATSGLMPYPLAELPVSLADLELSGPSFYGYEPLQRAIAARCDAPIESVVAATGTSMANHLVMAATLEPGDQVLIEQPTYELLVSTARYLGAEVRRFARHFADGFRLDPRAIARAATQRTRLIIITNLHNPSSALTDEDALREVGRIARRVGARVLVDEVYLDAAFDRGLRSAFHLGPEFITTTSLTKVYGLGGLRCGWILADPALARRLWRLNDLFGVIPAHVAERLSCAAFAHIDRVAARARRILEANRATLNRFLATRPDLESTPLEYGTVSFPRLRTGQVAQLCALLRETYDTTVVPGSFFEMPEHFRIGIGADPETFAGGLERLGAALDHISER
jgi:aspartate/methionine/tyrosine aminotransferase